MIPLVAVAHGSSEPTAAVIAREVVAGAGPFARVAFLEHEGPRPDEVLDALAAEGADEVVVLPLLLSHAGHARDDVATLTHPALRLRHGRALGPHPLLAAVVADRLDAAGVPTDADVLVLAAGTRDGAANAAVHELAADLVRRGRAAGAAACFASLADPRPAKAAAALRASGRPLAVAPYVLSWGRLARAGVQAAAPRWTAEPLGADPRLSQVLRERYDEALAATPAR